MIHYISNNYSLNNYSIADLGCGTGILGISAALCGCKNVFLFEIDEEALDIAKNNIEQLELEDNIQIIQMDVNQLRQCNKLNKYFDLVITNKNEVILYLEEAVKSERYFLYKKGGRNFYFLPLGSVKDLHVGDILMNYKK